MSYDFCIVEIPDPACCATCGHKRDAYYEDLGEPTYNIGPMFREACGKDETGENWFKQGRAVCIGDALAMWSRAAFAFGCEPEKYEAMNPTNGWGSFDGAVSVARAMVKRLSQIAKDGVDGVPTENLYFRP